MGGGTLDRIENIETCGNKIIHQRPYRTATMDKGFPGCMLVYPIIHLLMEREEKVAIGSRGNKGAVLRTEIGTCQICNRCPVTDRIIDLLEVYQVDFSLEFENLVDVTAARAQADVPLFNIANPSWTLQSRTRDA